MNPGTRLGSYEVTGSIGSGGMGEVYRARDTRLGRDVAMKILPAGFARNPDRLARFEREARLLAALNHPNVGAIYGVEDTGDSLALVLELVEGDTLQELIQDRRSGGPGLPTEEALAVAAQIADALEAAHEKGIVHRDLKPANVKIKRDGVVKLLDFGLGRLTPDLADAAPTMTAAAGTAAGAVLGTAPYMAPEQARGAVVDKRADIWAFGCVLYEMFAGVRAFDGETFSDAIAHVIERDPDWRALPARTPPGVRRLLRRCLEKNLRRRLRDIGDARLDLDECSEKEADPSPSGPVVRRGSDVRLERLTDMGGMVGSPAVSPDGKMVAFVAVAGARRHIWIRLLAGGAPLQVTRDDADHEAPRWMPDSSTLVYYSPGSESGAGSLWQVSALGGPARRVAPSIGGGDVSHDGRRVALFGPVHGEMALVVAALDGSTSRAIQALSPELVYDCPRWSPDDRLISFQRTGKSFDTGLDVVASTGGERRTLARAEWMRGHAWLPDGSAVVYSSSIGSTMPYPPTNNLRIIDRDGSDDRQLTFGDVSYLEPDIDASGRLLASRVRNKSDVWRFPIDGAPEANTRAAERVTRQTGQIQAPSIDPHGREIVYVSDNGGHSNLWVAAVDGSPGRQITFERDPGVTVALPVWSPTGIRIAFVRAHDARIDVCLINPDGSGFCTLAAGAFAPSWSGDGEWIYCARPKGRIDRVNVQTGAAKPVRDDDATAPLISGDGSTLYFTRVANLPVGVDADCEVCRAIPEHGPAEVLVRVPTGRVPLSPRLYTHANLSPDGLWLALPLIDGATTNVWLIPTSGGPMRAVTEFGERSVFIARWISWAPDSRHVYAAVADSDADIVALNGILG
jgi:eukaryotic-like serine/threonine-protein kinase